VAPCKVEELWRFPVKSMGGERLDHLEFGVDGVVGDRRFAVRDLETGLIASAKRPGRWGVLLSCRATTDADGDVSVTLPDGSAFRAGDAALGDALSVLTGRRVTLEHVASLGTDASVDYEAEYPELEHIRLRGRMAFPAAWFTDARSYVDLAAVHLMTTSTMAAIAEASGAVDVTPVRFRPNLVVDAGSSAGYLEDDWAGSTVQLGSEVALFRVMRAARCIMTSVEQPGVPRDNRILQTIARENRMPTEFLGQLPCAGIFAEVEHPGVVAEGDVLTIYRVAAGRGQTG
jgi:uncharacterized protein